MKTTRILALFVLSLAIETVPMYAKCALPRAFVSPEAKLRLPPDPTLYIFVPRYVETGDISAVGDRNQPLRVDLQAVPDTPAFRVLRLMVHTEAASSFVITSSNRAFAPHEYRVEASWAPAGPLEVDPVEIEREKHRWTCSYQRTTNLTLEDRGAPAYRVEWAGSRDSYLAGARESTVLPPDLDRFFTSNSEQEPGVDVLELGHVDCLGLTMEYSETPLFVGIVALHPDGSETIRVEEPIRVRNRAPAWRASR